MGVPSRADAARSVDSSTVSNASWSERVRYAFDNYMAKGTAALIGALFAASALVILLIAILVQLAGLAQGHPDTQNLSFPDLVWRNLLRTLDPGTMGADTGSIGFLAATLAVTMGGIFVISTLIGILSTGIESKLSELRKGRSRVIETGHIVIFGWSQQIFSIVAELVVANENRRRACIVVFADRDKVEMEEELRTRIGDTGRTRIVCRSGSPIDLTEIDIASVQTSRSVVILSPETDDPDADVIKTLLAITNDPNRRTEPYHIVAEIRDPRNLEAARMVGGAEVELVLVGELIARITAQTCRQSGLSIVYNELLDFGGDEIYFAAEPRLEGSTFGEALTAYENSMVLGVRRAGGMPELNPPMDRRIDAGDELIVIAEDDDKISLSSRTDLAIADDAIRPHSPVTAGPERTLILGWNWKGPSIIRELDGYVAPGSEVMVASEVPGTADDLEGLSGILRNQTVSFRRGHTDDRGVLDSLGVEAYDHVIILCYSDTLDAQRADAKTLVTLLHLRDMASRTGHRFSIVSEMLDMRNRSLAEVTRVDDFIVSGRLVSLLMSQIAENKALNAVFSDIFDSEGSEIYLKPVTDYVQAGQPVNFYTVVEAARRRGEVAFGYRLRRDGADIGGGSTNGNGVHTGVVGASPADANPTAYGVVVNPSKAELVTFTERDRLIVLASA